MTESERIAFLIKALEGGNGASFAKRIGVDPPTVSRMNKGKVGIRTHTDKILNSYPAVNRDWLETGEGYPGDLTVDLVKAHYQARINKNEMIIDHLIKRLNELESQMSYSESQIGLAK
jgi:hypothetical protein